MATFEATEDTTLSPGDVVEVKLKHLDPADGFSASLQAEPGFEPISSVAATDSSVPMKANECRP